MKTSTVLLDMSHDAGSTPAGGSKAGQNAGSPANPRTSEIKRWKKT